jgi:tetratricopeptide (TPR) repeat protein
MLRRLLRFSLLWVTANLLVLGAAISAASEDATNSVAAAEASEALMAARRLAPVTVEEVAQLLRQENFDELEHRTRGFVRRFASDPLWESPLCKLYSSIDGTDAALKEKLDKWVQRRPSYMSYTARGTYEVQQGFQQRGFDYIEHTPPENLERMSATMADAQADLEKALSLNPRFTPAYVALLGVAQAVGGVDAATRIEQRATREVPTTYYVRQAYLRNLTPRWGGSYELMMGYEGTLNTPARLNARIWSLKGESWAERGYTARLDNEAASAIEYYTKALQFGDRMEFLRARGTLYISLREYDLASQDFIRYQQYDSSDNEVNRFVQCMGDIRNGRACPVTSTNGQAPTPE